jgi:hypothetical protein
MEEVYVMVIDQRQIYTDLIGQFPTRSSKGGSYLVLVYYFDCNSILVAPMKSCSSTECIIAYGGIHQDFTARGFNPKLQTMDNEICGIEIIYHIK